MYECRKLSPEERQALVQERLARGFPPHKPQHPDTQSSRRSLEIIQSELKT